MTDPDRLSTLCYLVEVMPNESLNPWLPEYARRGEWRLTAYEFLTRIDMSRSLCPELPPTIRGVLEENEALRHAHVRYQQGIHYWRARSAQLSKSNNVLDMNITFLV